MQRQRKTTPGWQYGLLVVGAVLLIWQVGKNMKQYGMFGLNPTGLEAKKVEVPKAGKPPPVVSTSDRPAEPAPPPEMAGGAVQDAAEVEQELAALRLGERDPLARWYLTERELENLPPEVTPAEATKPPSSGAGTLVSEMPPPRVEGPLPPGPTGTLAAGPAAALVPRAAYRPALPERAAPIRTARRLMGTISSAEGAAMAVVRAGDSRASAEFLSEGDAMGPGASVRSIGAGRVELGGAFRREVMEVRGVTSGGTSGSH